MFHDIPQNTELWMIKRSGKVTSSGVGKIMARKKLKGGSFSKSFGDPAKKYAAQLALEQITGKPVEGDSFSNSHMDRGHAEEPIIKSLYEGIHFCEVKNGGFFDNGLTGDSPDGLVYKNIVVEFKSEIFSVHIETIKRDGFNPVYKWQLPFHIRESNRDIVDFGSYCSDFPEGYQIFEKRYDRDYFKETLTKMEDRLPEFHELVKKNKEIIMNRMNK